MDAFSKIETLIRDGKQYLDDKIELTELKVIDKLSGVITSLISMILVTSLVLGFIVFIGIGIAILIGQWLGQSWLGFLIVAGLYLFKAILIWKFRERLIKLPIINALTGKIFNNEEKIQKPAGNAKPDK